MYTVLSVCVIVHVVVDLHNDIIYSYINETESVSVTSFVDALCLKNNP